MARTLQQLKESIENLIAQQGADAPVAAFIFTKEDVFTEDEEGNQESMNEEDASQILNLVEENDWIYEQVFSCIEDGINDLKQSV